jgi:hypothetical protein
MTKGPAVAPRGQSEHHAGMSVRDVRHIYLAVIDAVSAGDDPALDELMAENLIDHNPAPGQPPGRAGFVRRRRVCSLSHRPVR